MMSGMKKMNDSRCKDTIVIIGNGFDIWQGYSTSYKEFQKYYLANRDRILRKLHIRKHVYLDEAGQKISLSDVELIYGNPFRPDELKDEFWGTFEASLDDIDAERINSFFGKDSKGLRKMSKSIRNANRILREAFCTWIKEIRVDSVKSEYDFGENCLFINFNYTDTLLKRFGVKDEDEYHIHGEAKDKKSIIFGHSSHPQLPESMLYKLGGRFRGLYFVEEILYATDKHVEDNLQELCAFLALHGLMPEGIKHVYVLGHSMSLPDIQYFMFFADATKVESMEKEVKEKETNESDEIDELHQRLQYSINQIGYGQEKATIDQKQRDAVIRRFQIEQEARNIAYQKMFMDMFGKEYQLGTSQNVVIANPRKEDAVWHISYYSQADKDWAEKLMKVLGCKKILFYSTIDECIQEFKKDT